MFDKYQVWLYLWSGNYIKVFTNKTNCTFNLWLTNKNDLQGVGFEPTQSPCRLWELKSHALDHSANLAIF